MRWAAAAALTAVLAIASAASAAAAPPIPPSFRHFEVPAAIDLRAHAEAGHGYELRLTADRTELPAQEGDPASTPSFVFLELAKPGAAAEYYSPRRQFGRDGSVEADWGAIGLVAARFVPVRIHRSPVRWCDGFFRVETGFLLGTVRFRGEHGYASLRASRIPATLTRRPKMECRIPPSVKPQESHESATVGGSAGRHGHRLGVSAALHQRLGTLTVYAYSAARRGGVYAVRSVSAVAPLTALVSDTAAETATLTAPSPFTGSATYRAFPGKEAGTWRGDLAVDFPGEPGVRLAGKRFLGAKLKPGECGPDESGTCMGLKLLPPIAIKPAQPLDTARAELFLLSG